MPETRAGEAGQRPHTVARCAVTIRDHGPITVADAARVAGLSRPTMEAAVGELVRRGLVAESGPRSTGGRGAGRPARRYAFAPTAGIVAGVDVGVHAVKAAVADVRGRVIAQVDTPIDGSVHGPGRMTTVTAVVDAVLARAAAAGPLVAMSVAVPGLVGPAGRLVASRNLPEWEGVDISGRLGARFGCPVVVDNDMRFAALAEHRLGAARLVDDVIYLFAGHRISMALIVDGTVRRGRHGAAGEVGDIIYSRHSADTGELRWSSAHDGEEVFGRAAAGDIDAQHDVARFVDGLASGLALTIMAIDPDLVVVGGGLSRAGDVLLDPLRAAVDAAITVPVRPAIVASEWGGQSAVMGALAHAAGRSSEELLGVAGLTPPTIDAAAMVATDRDSDDNSAATA